MSNPTKAQLQQQVADLTNQVEMLEACLTIATQHGRILRDRLEAARDREQRSWWRP